MSTPSDASHPRRNRPPTSLPVPIPPNPPSALLRLISSKSWHAVTERCASHPHEVGSSPCFRNDRGYTALHCVVAYNRFVAGEELVNVVNVMLRAAEEIDWGSEYRLDEIPDDAGGDDVNTNVVNGVAVENGTRRTGGSWRLLMDQKNDAQWSPLHLVFVLGGVTVGKVPLALALLQMNNNDFQNNDVESQHRRRHLLLLGDRQKRTILHHNCETRFPTDDNFEAANFLVSICPTLMFSRDIRGKTPLAYVLDKLKDDPVTSSGNSYEEGLKRCYRMLKFFIRFMEEEERRRKEVGQDELFIDQKDKLANETEALAKANNGVGRAVDNRDTTRDTDKARGFAVNRKKKVKAEASANLEVTETRLGDAEVDASTQRVSERSHTSSCVVSSEVTETSSPKTDIAAAFNNAVIETTPSESGVAVAIKSLSMIHNQTQFGSTINPIVNCKKIEPCNILHSACRLSRNACPSDGNLLLFLASPKASSYEYGNESVTKLTDERDKFGNYALHIFLSNESYAMPIDNEIGKEAKGVADELNPSIDCVECQIIRQLIASHPVAISTANDEGRLPLNLAMKSGMRNVIAVLIDRYPEAVLLDSSLENTKLFIHVLGCISLLDNGIYDRTMPLSAMYFLVNRRPDVLALAGSNSASSRMESAGLNMDQLGKSPPLLKRWFRKWLD